MHLLLLLLVVVVVVVVVHSIALGRATISLKLLFVCVLFLRC